MTNATPSPETIAALREYAAKHGRNWKDKLRDDWYHARTRGLLHSLRNHFGPEWLDKFKLPE